MSKLDKRVFDLRVSLRDISPVIWRLIAVSADDTVSQLHRILQGAFDWEDVHLHRFVIGSVTYEGGKGSRTTLRRLLMPDDRFTYTYDFGDWWAHDIEVLRTYEVSTRRLYPKVLDGAGDPPMEDCGGPPNYVASDRRFRAQAATWRVQMFYRP